MKDFGGVSMKSGAWKVVLFSMVTCIASPHVGLAQTMFGNGLVDFEEELDGTIPPGGNPGCCFQFHGPLAPNETTPPFEVGFSHEITATGGAGGSQGYHQVADGTAPTSEGGPGYWYAGVGQFYAFATGGSPLLSGVDGSNDPSRYRFSADVKVVGATVDNPLVFSVTNNDFDYEATYTVDANGDADLSDGADVYKTVYQPVLQNTSDYQTVSLTLNQGTIEWSPAGILPQHRGVFTNEGSLLWGINWGGAQFGGDAGNEIFVDNVKIEFLDAPEPVSGDYNDDGVVDSADYVVWRKQSGTSGPNADGTGPGLDGNPDGVVDVNDYNFWRANFGESAPGAGGSPGAAPEPAAAAMLVIALGAIVMRGARRRGH
jgi:hypothetical protein